MERLDERLRNEICRRCRVRLWDEITPPLESGDGYLCASCSEDREPLYHGDLLAILGGNTVHVRGAVFRVRCSTIERI